MAEIADRNRIKRYLGIREASTVHDRLIDELRASAKAMVETFLRAASATSSTAGTWSKIGSLRRGGTVAGSSSTTTAASVSFASLEAMDDYADRIKPELEQSITDTVAHLYRNRNPNASSETEGGGISESWDDVGDSGLPKRVERRLRKLVETLEA